MNHEGQVREAPEVVAAILSAASHLKRFSDPDDVFYPLLGHGGPEENLWTNISYDKLHDSRLTINVEWNKGSNVVCNSYMNSTCTRIWSTARLDTMICFIAVIDLLLTISIIIALRSVFLISCPENETRTKVGLRVIRCISTLLRFVR